MEEEFIIYSFGDLIKANSMIVVKLIFKFKVMLVIAIWEWFVILDFNVIIVEVIIITMRFIFTLHSNFKLHFEFNFIINFDAYFEVNFIMKFNVIVIIMVKIMKKKQIL